MSAEPALLETIKRLVRERRYRVRIHAVRHMIEEGFSEDDIVQAVTEGSKILENYPDESRCLVYGYYRVSGKVRSPLHVVCDYAGEGLVDIVTASTPQKPWWTTPTKRGRVL